MLTRTQIEDRVKNAWWSGFANGVAVGMLAGVSVVCILIFFSVPR